VEKCIQTVPQLLIKSSSGKVAVQDAHAADACGLMAVRAKFRYARSWIRRSYQAVAVIVEDAEQGEGIAHLNVLLHFGVAHARHFGD
jgi:hypothetical protein